MNNVFFMLIPKSFLKVWQSEEVAAMNFRAMNLNPSVENMQKELLDRHYLRKHGKNAYYGQKR